jgi:hypothetical protein
MRLKIFITTIVSAIALFCHAQTDLGPENNDTIRIQKSRYLTYQFGYLNSPIGKTFQEKGCMSNLGFNVARFFSYTTVLGVAADIKLIPGFGNPRLSSDFINDFNDNFSPQGTKLDSANADVVKINVNSYGPHGYGFRGNIMLYYGIMFSLFPNRAGGFMVQLKTGMLGFDAHQAVFENTAVPNISGDDKYPFNITRNWKFELTFKPAAFFRDTYIDTEYKHGGDFANAFSLTLFYERVNFATAEFNGTKFSSFLSNDFMRKYAFDNRFGFKIGFSLY